MPRMPAVERAASVSEAHARYPVVELQILASIYQRAKAYKNARNPFSLGHDNRALPPK
jgi:hypothetical protein